MGAFVHCFDNERGKGDRRHLHGRERLTNFEVSQS